ncbi:hypothetical protein [Puniceicoccus vermicola]|uniref:Alpha-L-arabinofuranosidase C-terminal domain-containing protein n=1 Tax=Puniceicoccus vermicola TaxID=388746 RepID=A0A7X1B1N5_9BACT|nr:hypothetical protein [Puniceicoccus vermicola]MBC2603976.1 hypothetical protein [Puniceicoccus vermicola]
MKKNIHKFIWPVIGLVSLNADESTSLNRTSWQNTIGVHYRLDPENYIGTTRGWPRLAAIGFKQDVTWLKPKNIEPVVGHFSGEERFYVLEDEAVEVGDVELEEITNSDPDRRSLDADALDALDRNKNKKGIKKKNPAPGDIWSLGINYIDAVQSANEAGIDLVIHTGGISPHRKGGGAREIEYLMAKNGAYFKDTLYETFVRLNTGVFADRTNTIYWEIGNEVNSSNRFSLRDITDGEHVRGHPQHGYDYVEFYLAPAIEALREASTDVYGDPGKVKILMGSVSGVLKPENREYLDLILGSTIEGLHAPTLAGKKVGEVIDAAVIHYSNGQRDLLQGIFDQWIASGEVKDLWTTEELGARGRGDYTVALVSFEWLSFVLENDWPEGAIPKAIFWGDERQHPGEVTTGTGAQEILGPFLKNYPLVAARNQIVPETRADLQWLAIRADVDSDEIRYAIHVHPYFTSQAALRGVSIYPDLGSLEGEYDVTVDCHVFSIGEENRTRELEVDLLDHRIFIEFDPMWDMKINESAVLLVTFQKL